jgi:hypothetical protein
MPNEYAINIVIVVLTSLANKQIELILGKYFVRDFCAASIIQLGGGI